MNPQEIKALASLCQSLGIYMTSAHAYSMDFLAALPQMIELAKETGIRQFVCKPPRECTQDALSAFAMKTIHLADRLSEAGIQLLLHNEEHEIRTVIDGQTAFEWLLDACGSKVSAQVDVGWVMRAGADPEALLWRLGNRVASVHYKDFDTAGKETTVGSGQLNILPCLQFARAHGCTQIVDMEHCTLLQLKQSIAALNVYRSRREKTISILSILDTQTGQTTDLRCLMVSLKRLIGRSMAKCCIIMPMGTSGNIVWTAAV